MHLIVTVIKGFQVGADLQRLFQRHLQLHGDELGHAVHVLVGHAHHAAHIAHGGAGGHRTKGDDLGHSGRGGHTFVDVVDDLLAALIVKSAPKSGTKTRPGSEAFKMRLLLSGWGRCR